MAESVFEMKSVSEFLRRELDRRLNLNSRYSLRAFARQLEMSPGELSEIIREKRPLSAKACQKVATHLDLSPAEFKHLLVMATVSPGEHQSAGTNESLPGLASQPNYLKRLDEDRFRLISDWWCFAILNYMTTEGSAWDSLTIAHRLGISHLQAQTAMARLERLQLIQRQPDGTAQTSHDLVEYLSDVPSEAIRRYHRSLLELATASLDMQRKEDRDITGIGMAVDKRDLKSFTKEIADFQEQMIAKYGRKRRGRKFDAVYQLEIALFRLDHDPDEHNFDNSDTDEQGFEDAKS